MTFHKTPKEAEYAHHMKTIQGEVATLLDMVKVLNALYLETLNTVSGFSYIELPNFELRRDSLPVEPNDYYKQVEWVVDDWFEGVFEVVQDDIEMDP